MITTIRRKIGVTLALVLAALSFAPTALADPPQFQLRRHAPETQVKDDPILFRNVEGMASAGLIDRAGGPDGYQPQISTERLIDRTGGPDGYQPQLSVRDNPVLLRGYGGTEPRDRGLVSRPGGPDGYQPQIRGFQPTVTIASSDGIDWAAAGSGVGIGLALSALALGAVAVARHRRPATS